MVWSTPGWCRKHQRRGKRTHPWRGQHQDGAGSTSDVEDWKAKVQQYKTRVTFLQQRLQEAKLEQYAQTAKLAQEGMTMAAKGQQAVKV